MKKLLLIIALSLFAASDMFAKTPGLQNSDLEKYTNLWQNFLTQYDAFLENYESTHPKAQALEKKVQLSYTTMREAYSLQYSRCFKMYKKHIDSGVKKGAPMVKDLELEIENLRVIGGKMKKTMTLDQQRELAKWIKDNKLPQKLGEVQLVVKSADESAKPQKENEPSPENKNADNKLPQKEIEPSAESVKAGDRIVKTINGVEFAFRYCPAGKFMMGSPETEEGRDNDELQHEVTLSKGFWIMETEVTQKQWQTVMGSNPSNNKGDNLPVEMVTWGMCQDFCKKCSDLGIPMALPTEAQWEYACRAGTTGPYAGELSELGWYNKDWGQKSRPVGTKKPNPWGIYDMHGNVCERCADWIGDYPSGPVTDPVGPAEGTKRIRRGGSTVWDNQPRQCRSAERAAEPPIGLNNFTGFRCVLSNDFDPLKSGDVKSENASQSSEPSGALVDFNNGKNAGDRAVKTVNGVEFAFRFCPAGKFMMGSPSSEKGRNADEIQHEVTLTKGFWMMETQVTQKQWQAIMGNNPSKNIGENHPVEQVSWNDCQAFCKKCVELGFPLQLPTEAQWEYACRAGTTDAFIGELNDIAWYRSTGGGRLHPVAMKKPNAWGLYDMIGNVWEWCQDWKANYPNWSVTDPAGPSSGTLRVNRGGGYGSWVEGCRSAYRGGGAPDHIDDKLGFRCVKAVD